MAEMTTTASAMIANRVTGWGRALPTRSMPFRQRVNRPLFFSDLLDIAKDSFSLFHSFQSALGKGQRAQIPNIIARLSLSVKKSS
jgi:hypothetical protein